MHDEKEIRFEVLDRCSEIPSERYKTALAEQPGSRPEQLARSVGVFLGTSEVRLNAFVEHMESCGRSMRIGQDADGRWYDASNAPPEVAENMRRSLPAWIRPGEA